MELQVAKCPRCRTVPLDDQPWVRHCARCTGSWISDEVLRERVAAADGVPPTTDLAWRHEARAALMCAICAAPMEALIMRGIPIDRCPAHGFWFDANELAQVLALVVVVPAGAGAESDVVSDATEVAVDLSLTVADGLDIGGAAVSDGVIEVVVNGVGFVGEVIVEIIGGIFSSLLD